MGPCTKYLSRVRIMDEGVVTGSMYRTARRDISLTARIAPTLSFYGRFLGVVFRASALARRGEYNGGDWAASSIEVLRLLEAIGVGVQITGLENFQKITGPCVIVGNHMSMMETLLLPGMVQPLKPVTFIVKESLLTYPVFKHIMRARDPVAVSRTNPRQDLKAVLDGGEVRLLKGISIIVFPQTTRSNIFDPGQMSSIGVKLAKKCGVPIMPLALKTDAWRNGKYLKDFGPIDAEKEVKFAFGEPLSVTGKGAEEQQAINAFIMRKLDEWASD